MKGFTVIEFIEFAIVVTIVGTLVALALNSYQKNDAPEIESASLRTKCIDGVRYFVFRENGGNRAAGYMSPKYTYDGNIELCDNHVGRQK